MGIRNTDKVIKLHKDVSFMPPSLSEVSMALDPNFVGGWKFTKSNTASLPDKPGITSVNEFEYNPAYNDAGEKIDYTPSFTKEQLLAKWTEGYNDVNGKTYKYDRECEYPRLGEQLDALFHDIDEGKLDKTGSFYALLKEVKDTYPKA